MSPPTTRSLKGEPSKAARFLMPIRRQVPNRWHQYFGTAGQGGARLRWGENSSLHAQR